MLKDVAGYRPRYLRAPKFPVSI